jgi:transcriptional regulator with XRE-family HTH domain
MKCLSNDILPLVTRRSLKEFGRNLRIARIRRRLTVASMAERCGVSVATWRRIEQGDPTVAIGAWAMALFILGDATALSGVLAPGVDEVGMVMDESRLPRRVRSRASERSGEPIQGPMPTWLPAEAGLPTDTRGSTDQTDDEGGSDAT